MKEMMKLKNEQIKIYKDSLSRVKSKSPNKYQSQEHHQSNSLAQQQHGGMQHSHSTGNFSNNHKRSQSQNLTVMNIKPQSANLLQQYNNYINLKQGNSRSSGTMSLNLTQTVPAGVSAENMKFLI